MTTQDEHHAALMEALKSSGVTIEDLARAWASIEGKRDEFDTGKIDPDELTGHYGGFVAEAEELVTRAVKYAKNRR